MGFLWTAATVALAFAPGSSLASLFWSNYEKCPQPCDVVGSTPSNWTYYHALVDLEWCREPLLFDLGLHTPLNQLDSHHLTIRACTVSPNGHDFFKISRSVGLPLREGQWLNNKVPSIRRNSSESATCAKRASSPEPSLFDVQLAWGGPADTDGHDIAAATQILTQYLNMAPGCEATIMFAQVGKAVLGLYVGSQIDRASVASIVQDSFAPRVKPGSNVPTRIGAQICGDQPFSAQTFGIYADARGNISAAQAVVRDWSTGRCLSEYDQDEILEGQSVGIWSAILDEAPTVERREGLDRRATCSFTQAEPGDGCWALTQKCRISEADLIKYNGGRSNFCSSILAGQYVCCGAGDLPDFSPKPNADGSCKSYTAQSQDTCFVIAAANQISDWTKLEDFNKQTWGWTGCAGLQPGQSLCLSTGMPPMPNPIVGATCGPQVPGTVRPTNGTKLADLNPCPLNVCCNIWGNCGLSAEFCIESPADTGAPGAAKPGSDGCISNCGMSIINSPVPPPEFRKVGYFASWNKDRPCLNMDVSKLEAPAVAPVMGGKYTHIHFAFPDLTPSFTVDVSKYQSQFDGFKQLSNLGAKKIVSFGGWDFSNSAASYAVFRNMVATELNRQKAARNIIRFVTDNNLDGVDFDWEYPGATDIDGTPEGSPDEGENYLKFLRTVRNSLPASKSLSIAAPSSFWYLKNFPIKAMSDILDYIIYMTYDLHGQWDSGNKWTSPGCPAGNCLRHHTNKTEVDLSLALITKAGVPANKVVVGMPLYGRSFKMAEAGCTGPDCFFLGDNRTSYAAEGVCTGTRGYISNVEIRGIRDSNSQDDLYGTRIVREISDKAGDILVYDDTEWVSWMQPLTYLIRAVVYKSRNFGGTSDWAIDLEYDFASGGDGEWYDPEDEGIDNTYSCDYSRTFKDLDDLNNNAEGLSLFCRQMFAIKVLEAMLDSLYAEYKSADNGYDSKFAAYVRYINRITPFAIDDYMTYKGGLNFFDCDMDPAVGQPYSRHCADFTEAERNEGYFDMTITLRDREGFFTDLLNKTGVAEEWINFNYVKRFQGYCENPGHPLCTPTAGIRDWHGWPQKNEQIDVANPKDLVTHSMGNIDELKLDIKAIRWDIAMGMWDGDIDDVIQVISVPIFMLGEAVEGMKSAKQMGAEEELWEEEAARNKAKELILTIIGAALFVIPFLGQAGATLAGATTLARFALIAGEVANAAFAIYGMVDDPNSAIMGLMGMMFGLGSVAKVGRTPLDFKNMAAKRASLRSSGGVSSIGGRFKARDDVLQNIIKRC